MIKAFFLIMINTSIVFCQYSLTYDPINTFKTYYGTKENPYYSYKIIPLINKNNEAIYITSNFLLHRDSLNYRQGLLSGFESVLLEPIKLEKGDTFNVEYFISAYEKAKDSVYIYYETTHYESKFVYRDSFKLNFEVLKQAKIKTDYYFQEQYFYPFEVGEKSYSNFNCKIYNFTDEIEIISIDSLSNKSFEFLGFAINDNFPLNVNLKLPFIIPHNDFKFACLKIWDSPFGISSDSLKLKYRNLTTKTIDSTYIILYMNIIEKKELDIYKKRIIHNSTSNKTTKYPFSTIVTNRFPKDIKVIKLTYQEPLEIGSLNIKMYNKSLPAIINPSEIDTIEIDFTPKELGQKVGRVNIEYEINGLTQYQFFYIVTQNDDINDVSLTKENPLAIYPNPVNSLATLLLDEEPSVGEQVGIYNSLGTLVKTLGVSGMFTQVNTEGFAEGVYIARLLWSGKSVKFCVVR